MKPSTTKTETHGGIPLVEEAIQILRRTPPRTLAAFYIGAIPFVLGLLWFWTDMSRGAYADRRLGGGALLLAGLFVWMKTWHAVFCTHLHAWIGREQPAPWKISRVWQMLVLQTAVQPWGLFLKPIALLITLPYPFARGFFEHILICPPDVSLRIRPSIQRASAEARLWPRGNTVSLLLLAGFGFFLTLNIAALIALGPSLWHSFTGGESTFTRSSYSFFNSTFLAAAVSGAYLCLNPIIKAVFVLRSFYGASIQSGADLRLQLRQIKSIFAVLVMVFFLTPTPSHASEKPASVSSKQLNRSIDSVLARPEYAWREPRILDPVKKSGWLAEISKAFKETITEWLKPVGKMIKSVIQKWMDWLRTRNFKEPSVTPSFSSWTQSIPWILGLCMALLLGIIGWLIWKQPRRKILVVKTSTFSAPDLTSEDIAADALPEEGWLTLAREMLDKGEVRLALRAFYLATLTQLASRQWITLARHKSNRDYELELVRKGRSPQPGREAFSGTRLIFERVWYGTAPATGESISTVQSNLEKIRQC